MIEHNLIALPELVVEKLIDNGTTPLEDIIIKYLSDCPNGKQRVADYNQYILNQLFFAWDYHDILFHLEDYSLEECEEMIEYQNEMLQQNKQFLNQNHYYLKQFPMFQKMYQNYKAQKHYVKTIIQGIYIKKQIQMIKKKYDII